MNDGQTLTGFLDELASAAPTPGGGGAAAVAGAMGAGLISMVCRLTIGKKAYSEVEDAMQASLGRAEALREKLLAEVAEDARVFDAVMGAYRLPRESEQDKATRGQAIQAALREATLAPMRCARLCLDVIELGPSVAAQGNRNVLSDVGVAMACANAGARSAALNVYINTGSIEDQDFAAGQLEAVQSILEQAGRQSDQVYDDVALAVR